jgi:hypothetical protein
MKSMRPIKHMYNTQSTTAEYILLKYTWNILKDYIKSKTYFNRFKHTMSFPTTMEWTWKSITDKSYKIHKCVKMLLHLSELKKKSHQKSDST